MPDAQLSGGPAMIRIALIRRDGGTQPRAALDPATVETYAEAAREGVVFPEIGLVYDGTDYWLWDGFHRTAGFEMAGLDEIAALVKPGTRRDAVLLAAGANATHGLRRTSDDKRRAVLLLLADEEWGKWSDREIARRANVGHPLVAELRRLTGSSSSERTFRTKHGTVATMDTAAMGKRAADIATIRSLPVEALHQIVSEQHRARQDKKKARRAEREQELGEKIASGNAALVAAGASGKRYGVILADPEWPFDVYSNETGMDRSPDNHYPTSPIEAIAARPVPAIMADDCALLLWVTGPHLENGFRILNAWGFNYRSHWVGVKDRIGTGYWNRNKHELLLLGIRGNVPAPAMGTQFDSVQPFPVREHSRKPEFAHLIAEHYWPNLPKIELNAREARETWDVWGAEAPEGAPITVGVDLSSGPDRSVEVTVDRGGSLSFRDLDGDKLDACADDDEVVAPKVRKGKAARPAKKQAWEIEAEERQARIDALAAELPADLDALSAAYRGAIDAYDAAVMAEDAEAAAQQRELMDAVLFRANGRERFGIGVNEAPETIRRASRAPCGTVPKWGQVGQFIVEHRGVRAIICFGDHEGVHAVAFNRPFPSQTGFHSISAARTPGMSVIDYGKAMLDGAIDYRPDGAKGPARQLVLPEHAYRLERDERGYLLHRERGVLLDPAALPDGVDIAALDAIRDSWREEDRARLHESRKGKRRFPECLHWNDKIIAIAGGTLTPVADFPTTGAYVVTDRFWDAAGNHAERWRYVADATRLDEGAAE